MALFGNDMFGHHMLSQGQSSAGFGKSNSGSTFGSSTSHNHQGGHSDPNTAGHIGNHSIFGRQKSLLHDMTSSKNDKAKPYVFSSYSYPYDFHHEGMASMFEKPLEKAKKRPELKKQQSYSPGDKPELRRAPSFSSNPKLMRSKTINPSDTALPRPRPKLSRSLSIADDQTAPANMDLAIPDFLRRNSERQRKKPVNDPAEKPKKKSWSDIARKITRKKRSSKDRTRHSTASTDDSARESMGSTSSVGTFDSSKSHLDSLPSEEIPRCNTIDSKFSRASIRSRSSCSSDYDKEQEKLILSLLNNDFSQEDVFDDRVPSKESDTTEAPSQNSVKTYTEPPPPEAVPFDPLQPVEDDIDEDEQQKNYSESPTLVLRRIKHLHPPEAENASLKSANSGRLTPKSYFSDTSEQSAYTEPKKKPKGYSNRTTTVIMRTDPSDSDASGTFSDAKPIVLTNRPRRSSDKKKKEPELVEEKPPNPITSPRASVHDIVKNFQNLKTSPEKEGNANKTPMKEDYKPEPVKKAYVEPKVFTVSPPQAYRPFTSIYTKPVIPGYTKEPLTDQPVTIQHVQPYAVSSPIERVSPKFPHPLRVDPEGKDTSGNDNLTADSSESGYGTSHIANSPKGYDNMKVLNFVNSLPNHSDMEEQSSELSHDELLMNGSETESIEDDDDKSEIFGEPRSDLSNVKCVSGSDTDIASIDSNISESRLEVTKLLESPTEVRERVTSEMSRHSSQSSPSVIHRKLSDPNTTRRQVGEPFFSFNSAPRPDHSNKKCNDDDMPMSNKIQRDPSETELLRVYETEKKPDLLLAPSAPVEADVEVVISKPQSMAPGMESKLYRGPDPSDHSMMYSKSSRPLSYASSRQYSTIQESPFTQCIDGILHLLNCLLVICSIGVIAAGVWLLMKDFNVNHVTIILGDNLLQVIVYVSIAGAVVAILAALCLCCGVKKDKYGLSFFAIVLIIVIIAFSSAAILSAVFADKLHGIEFRINFKERLISKYGNITETDRENEYFTASWDSMQTLFECCGAEGEVSDMSSWAVFKKFSMWYRKQPYKATIYVPESCCKKDMNMEVCQGSNHHLLGPPVYGPPMDDIYSQKNPNLNTTGCYDFFASYLARLTTIVAIVMGGLAGLYLLTVMLTWVFCFKKNQDYEDYLYGSFYEMGNEDDRVDYHYNTEHEMETKLTHEYAPTKMDYTSNGIRYNSAQSRPNPEYVINHDPSIRLTESIQHTPNPEYVVNTSINNGVVCREPEHFNNVNNPPIEETSFTNKPTETIHEKLSSMSSLEEQIIPFDFIKQQESAKPVEYKMADNNIEDNESESESSESDSDSENESQNTTFRRNLWLSSESGRAVNLLSIAIEEEDSNFEDSDAEEPKVQNDGTYRRC